MKERINLLTTPLFYANGLPHIGNMYTSVILDIFKNYLYSNNIHCFLVTGLDENGQKVSDSANNVNVPISFFLKNIREEFKNSLSFLKVNYDYFISTSDKAHKEFVIMKINFLYSKNVIYMGKYEGYYSIKDETFLTNKDVEKINNKYVWKKDKTEVIRFIQNVYYLKTKQHHRKLKQLLMSPFFLEPKKRTKEIINMLKEGELQDLCISRKKLGIKNEILLPFDLDHSLYIWVDALYGYYSSLHSLIGSFSNYRINSFHLVGKEIVKFHSIYLPILLNMTSIKTSSFSVYSHNWILMNENKMSKSKGNVILIKELQDQFTFEEIRYYFFSKGPILNDVNMSIEDIENIVNVELVNKYSNLCYRLLKMLQKYNPTWLRIDPMKIVRKSLLTSLKMELKTIKPIRKNSNLNSLFISFRNMNKLTLRLIEKGNTFLTCKEPWNLFSNGKQNEGESVLFCVLLIIIISSFLLYSVFPISSLRIMHSFDLSFESIRYLWNKYENLDKFIYQVSLLLKNTNTKFVKPIMLFKKKGI